MGFFSGKCVVVTGSSNGIGRTTAVFFAKQGACVTITGRSGSALDETKKLCLQAGAKEANILKLIGDITDASFNERLIGKTVEIFGRLDVLVNNAGGGGFANFGKGIVEIPIDEFEELMCLNVKQVLRLSQLAVPHLAKTKGAIINISSVAAHHYLTPMPYYSVSKCALDQVTIQMAGSLIKKGIRVNSVNPGPVATNIYMAAGSSKEDQDKVFDSVATSPANPLGRIGQPEDIAKIILFLADRTQSEIIIGHILNADGGVTIMSGLYTNA